MPGVNDIPLFGNIRAIATSPETYTSFIPSQTDIPHLIDISRRQGHLNQICTEDGYVDEVTTCPEPNGLCSGSHRVILGGIYRGARFLASIEDIEGRLCGY